MSWRSELLSKRKGKIQRAFKQRETQRRKVDGGKKNNEANKWPLRDRVNEQTIEIKGLSKEEQESKIGKRKECILM